MNIKDFINCRISDFKLWYLRWTIESSIHKSNIVMDIGCGQTKIDYVPYDKLYRIDPTITIESEYDIKGTWEDAIEILKRVNVDCVFLMDVVEHLEKEEAIRLLKQTELYARYIVVFTPLGFMEQNDGEWNTHRSGWLPEDFGKGWVCFDLPWFHTVDFKNNPLPQSHGAILAVYTR
jgi:hypothetical protein